VREPLITKFSGSPKTVPFTSDRHGNGLRTSAESTARIDYGLSDITNDSIPYDCVN